MALMAGMMLAGCSKSEDENQIKEEPVSPNIEAMYRLELWSKDMVDWRFRVPQLLIFKETGNFTYIKDVIDDDKGAHEVTEEGTYIKRGSKIYFSPNNVDDIIREARINKDTIWVTIQEKAGIRYVMGHHNDIYNQ